MGYDVHITRQNNWWEKEPTRLTSEVEWRELVEADAEMRLVGELEVESPTSEGVRYGNPLLAEWLGHPEHKSVGFDFHGGRVVVKNADEMVLAKMRELAARLGARVQGDEGELY